MKKIYPKHLVTSGTTEDLIFGGKVPKAPPRPDATVWVIRVNPEPPPGWRPDSLQRDA